MTALLVTGFGPFPGVTVNPSQHVVAAIEAAGHRDVAVARLATEWAVCAEVAARAADAAAVLMFGVAPGARSIRYERVALPGVSRGPDAAGAHASVSRLTYRRSQLPVPHLAAEARLAGFPVTLSSSAGTYICNASYGAALSANPRTLFVHIPMPMRHGPLGPDGLAAHGLWLVDHLLTLLGHAGPRRPTSWCRAPVPTVGELR